jgi:hypothetical protein
LSQGGIEQLWLQEAVRRHDAIAAGGDHLQPPQLVPTLRTCGMPSRALPRES